MPGPGDDAGRSAYDIVEAGAGGRFHRALLLHELEGAVEAVEAEFEHDTAEEPAVELVRILRELREHMVRLSIAPDASLSLNRECGRCSGRGRTTGEDPCFICGGMGAVHADEGEG